VLAPLRPGGSWLALKALPLIAAARGVLGGDIYTHRWALMLVLAYVAEAVVRLIVEDGVAAVLAALELVLACAFFTSAIAYVRARRAP
jgi:uncharacterized membrane protein